MMTERLTSLRRWAVAALLAASAFRPVQGFDAVRGSVPARVELGGGVTEAVRLAAADLERDLRRLAGCSAPTGSVPGRIRIAVGRGDSGALSHDEGYDVRVAGQEVVIRGADELGAIYGIYAFEERCLGVSPFMRFSGQFPGVLADFRVDGCSFSDWPKTYRFRGWFVNDEDLLSAFRNSGGTRDIDFWFYRQVADPSVMEMVVETALRLRLNLIIPGTLIDVENPPEKALADVAARRGLWVSQHHLEPVGVSYFSAEKQARRRRGADADRRISLVSNRELLVDIWRTYVKAWAKYPKVVWQLGIRGRGDKPVWRDDPAIGSDDASRAAVVQGAIDEQVRLIREATGREDFVSTLTLWAESSVLCAKGLLKLPKSTIAVFSDFSFHQMLRDDFFTTPREPGRGYGIYYHAAYCPDGPHRAEGVSPWKMDWNYRQSIARGDTAYSILNVSNVREFALSAELNAALVWDAESCEPGRGLRAWCARTYGETAADAVAEAYGRYFRAFPVMSRAFLAATAETPYGDAGNRGTSCLHDYPDSVFGAFDNYTLNDGVALEAMHRMMAGAKRAPSIPDFAGTMRRAAKGMAPVLAEFEAAERLVPADCLADYRFRTVDAARFLVDTWSAAAEMADGHALWKAGDSTGAMRKLETCRVYLLHVLEAREREDRENREWRGWYRGDEKMAVELLIRQMDYFIKDDLLGFQEKHDARH